MSWGKIKNIFISPANTKILVIVVIGVLVFRDCLYESYRIPSTSMVPSLEVGDYIVVSKLKYKLKFPFTNFTLINFSRPQKGDIVVFKFPKDRSTDFIKRVIAVEGDTVEVKEKILYINGIKEELKKIKTPPKMKGFSYYISNKYGYTIRFLDENFLKADMKKRTIEKNKLFVLGDNRDYSYDSRFWGDVDISDIVGSPELIWFSSYFSKDGKVHFNNHRVLKELN